MCCRFECAGTRLNNDLEYIVKKNHSENHSVTCIILHHPLYHLYCCCRAACIRDSAVGSVDDDSDPCEVRPINSKSDMARSAMSAVCNKSLSKLARARSTTSSPGGCIPLSTFAQPSSKSPTATKTSTVAKASTHSATKRAVSRKRPNKVIVTAAVHSSKTKRLKIK
jgi:hypothetical protein